MGVPIWHDICSAPGSMCSRFHFLVWMTLGCSPITNDEARRLSMTACATPDGNPAGAQSVVGGAGIGGATSATIGASPALGGSGALGSSAGSRVERPGRHSVSASETMAHEATPAASTRRQSTPRKPQPAVTRGSLAFIPLSSEPSDPFAAQALHRSEPSPRATRSGQDGS